MHADMGQSASWRRAKSEQSESGELLSSQPAGRPAEEEKGTKFARRRAAGRLARTHLGRQMGQTSLGWTRLKWRQSRECKAELRCDRPGFMRRLISVLQLSQRSRRPSSVCRPNAAQNLSRSPFSHPNCITQRLPAGRRNWLARSLALARAHRSASLSLASPLFAPPSKSSALVRSAAPGPQVGDQISLRRQPLCVCLPARQLAAGAASSAR